jgi:hypothetical protein
MKTLVLAAIRCSLFLVPSIIYGSSAQWRHLKYWEIIADRLSAARMELRLGLSFRS